MDYEKIDLQYDPERMHLQSKRNRKWFFVFWGSLLIVEIALILYRFYDQDDLPTGTNYFILGLSPVVAIMFIIQGIYAMRQDRQLFVAFERDKIRFRDRAGAKVTAFPLTQLRSVEQHTLGAYFHLVNGKKIYMRWEEADYDNIQHIKAQIHRLQDSLKVMPS